MTNLAWQPGFLGDFYQPTDSPLLNAGSLTNAGLAGLYHYATTTNQVKETNSIVDIGYHCVAVTNGLPVDTDGDSVADYLEDTNGNGIFDGGDLGDWTNFLYSTANFAALNNNTNTLPTGWRPDVMGAVGSNHFMAVLNGAVAVYEKSNGTQVAYAKLEDFLRVTVTNAPFAGTYPKTDELAGDPRVLYDPVSERWFACALNATERHTLLAISKTSDPVGSGGATWVSNQWDHYLIPTGWRPATNLMDQPRLAVDSNGVYIANFALAGNVHETHKLRVTAMPKAQFLNSSAATLQTNFTFDCPSNYYAQPAVNFDPVATNDPVWFISVNGTNLYYNLLVWTNGFTNPPEFQMANWGRLAISQSFLPLTGGNAPLLNADGFIFAQLMNTVVRKINGTQYLWTCQHIGVNRYGTNATPSDANRTSIEWFKIHTTPTVDLADTGRIFDEATTNPKFYYFPSLTVNKNGDMVIGFSGSSNTNLVSAYYWGKLNNGASPSGPICYFPGRASTNDLGTVKGGDYSSTTLDPVDALTIWTIQEYAETNSPPPGYTWGTSVGRISPY